mmetsp:Transcript_28217/g.42706  ORF Transcript_28217/g.42706 Transcript_28217/m.42706 type:complete len:87 (-) Transcript_28217:1222-1482(-)
MKVVSSLRPICKDCYIVRRGKRIYLRCKTFPRHKRRQGFSSLVARDSAPLPGLAYVEAIKPMPAMSQVWLRAQLAPRYASLVSKFI